MHTTLIIRERDQAQLAAEATDRRYRQLLAAVTDYVYTVEVRSITRMLKLNLEGTQEFVVRTENKGAAAVAAAEQFKPHLAILDVMMPDIDGGNLASLFRANAKLKDVPIVFLTAAVTKKEVMSRGGEIGGSPFLAKPVRVPDVLDCVRKQLGG